MTTNSRPNSPAILKDVVAYVDVWSSSKTENYSKSFIQQLQDMGAEVSKTFNKQVTHVVFKNGHQATWNKAKKTGVRLVSVLWVARCKDDGEHVDEELCPALNDEVNSALKKRVHRCMQPRDTPENDRRMKKKLDKMIKDLVPKSPLITDVSPYIIDEENGIVYSPSMKRSDSMAQRLKEMRETRENLSPTASQMGQSRLSPEFKPSLGSTPSRSFLQHLDEESDEDLNASFGSNKTDGEKQQEATSEPQHKKHFQKPWKSSCSFRASSCADDDDDGVFVDFFSPANNPGRQRSRLLPSLPSESKVQIPFELEPQPSPGKRKRGKSETTGS
ncbi:hypothetical protein J4Q44_G00275790 [Coregonus suidteri]|uniref:BRCT domain-containing protein n=1 Tax=Coregonus suidteri TaxID=861788 RepID=A0AAN8LAF4_9TELE